MLIDTVPRLAASTPSTYCWFHDRPIFGLAPDRQNRRCGRGEFVQVFFPGSAFDTGAATGRRPGRERQRRPGHKRKNQYHNR